VIAVAVVAAGCGGTTTTTAAQTTTTAGGGGETTTTAGGGGAAIEVKVGAIGPFTGQLSKIGLDALNAQQMAVDEFNAAQDKVKVTKIEVGDDAADPAKSAAVAEKFVADAAIMGVIGPMTSAGIQAALPVLEKGNLAMITQSGTNDALSQGGFKVFHRICPVDAAQGGAVAGIIADDLKAKKVYIVDDKGTYGQGLADQVEKTLKDKYQITDIQRAQITPEDKDFNALITKVKAYGPDVFFAAIPSPAQFATIAKQMQAQGYTVQLVGADGVKDKGEFIDNAGGATEGCYFTSLGPLVEESDDPVAQEFVKKYIEKYQVLSMFSAQSYEAMNVLLDAIHRAYDANGGQVTREGVMEALKTTKYTGVLGLEITFTEQGDLNTSGVFIGQVKDGKFIQIKEAQY